MVVRCHSPVVVPSLIPAEAPWMTDLSNRRLRSSGRAAWEKAVNKPGKTVAEGLKKPSTDSLASVVVCSYLVRLLLESAVAKMDSDPLVSSLDAERLGCRNQIR